MVNEYKMHHSFRIHSLKTSLRQLVKAYFQIAFDCKSSSECRGKINEWFHPGHIFAELDYKRPELQVTTNLIFAGGFYQMDASI